MKKIIYLLALVLVLIIPNTYGNTITIYQEDGNETGSTGWIDDANLFDGNWGTTAYASITYEYAWVNYSKNTNYLNTSLWQVKDYENTSIEVTVNLTIPSVCWNYNEEKLIFQITSLDSTTKAVAWFCRNGSQPDNDWLIIRNVSNVREAFEEAMYFVAVNDSITANSRVADSSIGLDSDLIGYCNASLAYNHTEPINLFMRWYNGSYNFLSYNLSSVSQGIEYSFTIDNSLVNLGDTWNFNCYASSDYFTSAWTANQSVGVYNYSLDNCSTFGNVSATINIYDEQYPYNTLNAYIEIEGSYWQNPTTKYNFSFISNNSDSYGICISQQNITLYSDLYIKYTSDFGFTHRYYVFNQSLSNETINISLYNFNTQTGISDITMTIRDAYDYTYKPNVLGMLQRHYIGEGVWRTVQHDLTGDYGQLLFNIEEEDTDYRFIFMDTENHILDNTESMKFICTSGHCTVTYTLDDFEGGTEAPELVADVDYVNETGIVYVTWDDATGRTNEFSITVSKETGTTSIPICSNSSVASSGNFSCDIGGYTGLIVVRGIGGNGDIKTRIYEPIEKGAGSKLHTQIDEREGAMWSAIIIVATFGAGLVNPVGGIIGVILGLTASYLLQLMGGVTITLIIVAAALGTAIGLRVRR